MILRILPILGMTLCVACGTSSKSPDDPTGNRGGDNATSNTYWDVKTANNERIPTNKFPSQLREGELQDACKPGQVFEFDACWDSIIIDADALSIQFLSENGLPSQIIQVGKSVPQNYSKSILQGTSYAASEEFSFFQHHHLGVKPVVHETCYPDYSANTILLQTGSAWGWLVPSMASGNNAPWSSSKCFAAKDNILKSIAFKATFLYGFENIGETKSQMGGSFRLVHNWDYKGSLRMNGINYALPVSLSAIEPDISKLQGEDGIYFVEHKTAGGVAKAVSIPSVIEARKTYAGGALAKDKLVTEIIFGTIVENEDNHDATGDLGLEAH